MSLNNAQYVDSEVVDEASWPLKDALHKTCEYIKLFLASAVVICLVIIAFTGIANGWCILQTPPAVSFILLFGALILLAYVEALHYACK